VSYALHTGNCIDVMRAMPAESVDAVVTDPPYGLKFMGKKFDDLGEGAQQREWHRLWAVEALRVLKPGGYLLAMGGSRTYHHLASGVEEAGFEIRDRILYITGGGEVTETIGPELAWIYGSGFPKSHDVSKGIDKAAGAEREVVGPRVRVDGKAPGRAAGIWSDTGELPTTVTAPATPEAEKWAGWGTALKPAHEPICVARKPLAGTVAANVLAHGTGALNIDACRVGDTVETWPASRSYAPGQMQPGGVGQTQETGAPPSGRWPANVILDEDAAAALDEQAGERKSGARKGASTSSIWGSGKGTDVGDWRESAGGASRFFYVAKPGRKERETGLDAADVCEGGVYAGGEGMPGRTLREGVWVNTDISQRRPRANTHPTVKPITLMRYLCRLVAAPGAVILDPFLGSGTTGCAVAVENNDLERAPGWSFVGIDEDADYMKIARARIAHWAAEGATSTDASSIAA
jgi:site-specific DNA-methyltransferase (adenine-specific)